MSEASDTPHRMSVEEFLEWQLSQDKNYELVDGIAELPAKAMTEATSRHDYITVNVLAAVRQKLRGKPCRAHTDNLPVVNPNGNVRRPDIVVTASHGPTKP